MELNPCFQKSFWLKPFKDQTKALSVAKVSARNVVPREKRKGFTSWKKSYFLKYGGDETTLWISSSDSNTAML